MDERNEIEGIKYINAGTFTSATVSLLKSLSMLWETVAMWMVWVTWTNERNAIEFTTCQNPRTLTLVTAVSSLKKPSNVLENRQNMDGVGHMDELEEWDRTCPTKYLNKFLSAYSCHLNQSPPLLPTRSFVQYCIYGGVCTVLYLWGGWHDPKYWYQLTRWVKLTMLTGWMACGILKNEWHAFNKIKRLTDGRNEMNKWCEQMEWA